MARIDSFLFASVLAGVSLAIGCGDAAGPGDRQVAQDVTSVDEDASDDEATRAEPSADNDTPAPKAAGRASGGAAMPAAPSAVSVAIDGRALVVDDVVLWSNVSRPGDYDIFLEVHGPDVPSGSSIHVSATRLGTGCDAATNFITFRPESDTPYVPSSSEDPSCGLAVEALPTGAGDRFTGSFEGTVRSIDPKTLETKTLEVRFDVLGDK